MLQVQALVAEHKLGVQGRKLGVAMTKELINTPGRLAYVKPAASTSWAAIKQRKSKQSRMHLARPASRSPQLGRSATTAAHAQTETAECTEAAESDSDALSSEASEDEVDMVPRDTMRSTVKFMSPEVTEDSAQVQPQQIRAYLSIKVMAGVLT